MTGSPDQSPFRIEDEAFPALPDGAIHVWSAPLDVEDQLLRRLEKTLSDDERDRAARFYFERDRNRVIACRGRLRELLAGYLQKDAREIAFEYGSRGKPALAGKGAPPLHFNVSHSHDWAVFAFRRRGELGVDVEKLRTLEEMESIARRYFTPRECSSIFHLPPQEQTAAFFRCWTRKEALLKATGVGLSVPLNEVEVTLSADEPARVLAIHNASPHEADRWRLEHWAPAPGYVAALAAEDSSETLEIRLCRD